MDSLKELELLVEESLNPRSKATPQNQPQHQQQNHSQTLPQKRKTLVNHSALKTNTKITKIFRSRPTFRQLLIEYNGVQNSLSKIIRPNQDRFKPDPNLNSFTADSIEVIEVPEIAGKILRPQNN
jgi:hypothetical protein